MPVNTCKVCGSFILDTIWGHECPPLWECRPGWGVQNRDDFWKTIHAHSARRAAQTYAERYDREWGNPIRSLRAPVPTIIHVRAVGAKDFERFSITVGTIVHYDAEKVA